MRTPAIYVSRGRFRSGCVCGGNGRIPDPRTSNLETTVFNVLDFVLVCGQQDVPVPFDGRMNLDMLFVAETGYRLGVEYDGAYWHHGRERSDWSKSERLVGGGFVHDLMRIREAPLAPIGDLDLIVPNGARGQEVAALSLTHLSHTVAPKLGDEVHERIDFHVYRPGRTLDRRRISCPGCRWATRGPSDG